MTLVRQTGVMVPLVKKGRVYSRVLEKIQLIEEQLNEIDRWMGTEATVMQLQEFGVKLLLLHIIMPL